MNHATEARQLIAQAQNICLVPSQTNEPESLTAALALFYTLKELNKNVNLIIEDLPEKLSFLVPSLDFISSPKNFTISIPRSLADISQIYYEKNESDLKIHLTIDKGKIKKENVNFYFSDPRPDLVITLGIKDLQSQLSNQLDAFGFILDTPILNIDNHLENKKFGSTILFSEKSLSEIILDIIKSFNENSDGRAVEGSQQSRDLINNYAANCLMAGLVIHYENFKSLKITSDVFQICGELLKKGAAYQQVIDNLYKTTEKEISFLGKLFQNMKTDHQKGVFVSVLDSDDFQNFAETEASYAVEKIKSIGMQNDLLVLWKSHASSPMVKGFIYSKKQGLINKIAADQQGSTNKDWLFLSMPELDINIAKDKILSQVNNFS